MPEDVHAVVHPALDHRIVRTTEADGSGVDQRTVVEGAVTASRCPRWTAEGSSERRRSLRRPLKSIRRSIGTNQ
ncbi:hypothetical protein C477_07283 [Haloterrigena salina JCM 13891]|uniref:Uncharacterized protein n=1 Tax=Haloterrigena salina JCM 13891 TaxID=1227488 RepID=M0CBM8_9EURY|nr:hypothetical protein C477_07283 [Haloterrigena salina JCM 13891]